MPAAVSFEAEGPPRIGPEQRNPYLKLLKSRKRRLARRARWTPGPCMHYNRVTKSLVALTATAPGKEATNG